MYIPSYSVIVTGCSFLSLSIISILPISAVFFAYMIMNDQFYAIDFIGMGMILLAVLLISLKDLIIQKEKGIL